jgi:hypothetical protein
MKVDKYGLPIPVTTKDKLEIFLSGIGFGLVAFGLPVLVVAWKSGALKGILWF